MTLRSAEDRAVLDAAAKIKRAENKAKRLARKEEARQHIRAVVESRAPNKRQPREKNNGFLAFVRRHPCCVCGGSPVDAAHTRFTNLKVGRANPGMGSKPSDRFATPLCRADHTAQHMRGNEAAWWAEHGLDPDEISARLFAAFLAGSEPLDIEALRHGTARNASAKGGSGMQKDSDFRPFTKPRSA